MTGPAGDSLSAFNPVIAPPSLLSLWPRTRPEPCGLGDGAPVRAGRPGSGRNESCGAVQRANQGAAGRAPSRRASREGSLPEAKTPLPNLQPRGGFGRPLTPAGGRLEPGPAVAGRAFVREPDPSGKQAGRTNKAVLKHTDAEAAASEAASMGWLMIEGGHSVCLTHDHRQQAESRKA